MTAQEYTLQEQQIPPASPPSSDQQETPPQRRLSNKIIITFIAFGGLILFLSGFFIRGSLTPTPPPPPTPTPLPTVALDEISPSPTVMSELPSSTIQFLPGKQYFDDMYVVINKQKPHQSLMLSVARIEQQRNYIQYTKLNYYNGSEWIRKTVTSTLQQSQVTTNPLVREWHEPAKVIRNARDEQLLADLSIEQDVVSFASNDLQNEISVQSVPGSTKFIYQGKGSITINGAKQEAYILYLKTYSFNAAELAFLTNPADLTSDWVAFWDTDNNFYYVDSHSIPNPTSEIQKRRVGIVETNERKVTRVQQLRTAESRKKDISEFIVEFDEPIEEELRLLYSNQINKSGSSDYSWILSFTEGVVVKNEGRKVNGVGIFEYIKQK